jgi:hypothetical protein
MRQRLGVPLIMVAIMGSLQPPSLAAALPVPVHDLGPSRLGTITVYDPDDVPMCDTPPWCSADIHFISERSFIGGTGRRMLAFTVAAYEPHEFVTEVSIKLRFDASGGPRPDRYVFMGAGELSFRVGWYCGRRLWSKLYRVRVRYELMTCFMPERDLHTTKPIRFQVFSKMIGGVEDRAPDQGWAG